MSDFTLTIDDNVTNIINVESSSLSSTLLDQGSLDVTINENSQILNIEASFIENINNIEIQKFNDYNLTLSNSIYGQLPDEIPMSIITGNISVNRIDGLDTYLTTIPLDGGSP